MKPRDAPMRAGTPALLLGKGTQAPPFEKGWYSRGYVPHFDVSGLYQAITYRLGDSLPRSAGVPPASPLPPAERRQQVELELNKGYGACILRDREIAQIVVNAWKHFDGQRYKLVAYVVMPNHVHVLIKTYASYPLSKVVHSWKSFTAHAICKHLQTCGRDARAPVWQNDYFDRFIRDEQHFAQTIAYIHENPVKAGLCTHASEWPWSSIHEGSYV